jgi:hypothetical protein
MSKQKIIITENNFNEWLRSTGYFLPIFTHELTRFEKLYTIIDRYVDDNLVDPLSIIKGTRKPIIVKLEKNSETLNDDIEALRIAARNHSEIPQEIIARIKKNQTE